MDSDVLTALLALPLDLVLWGLIAVFLVGFTVFSGILIWHWQMYSTGKYTTVTTIVVYLGVSTAFFALMCLSALWYALS